MSILISRGEHRNRRYFSKHIMLQDSCIKAHHLKSDLSVRHQLPSKCSQLITFTKVF